MIAVVLLTLFNLVTTYALVRARETIIKVVAALYSLIMPIFITIGAGQVRARYTEVSKPRLSGSTLFFIAHGALTIGCLVMIIQGIASRKPASIILGCLVLAVTLFLMWVAYDLTQTSWKIGG